jgi:hypothetical protein
MDLVQLPAAAGPRLLGQLLDAHRAAFRRRRRVARGFAPSARLVLPEH